MDASDFGAAAAPEGWAWLAAPPGLAWPPDHAGECPSTSHLVDILDILDILHGQYARPTQRDTLRHQLSLLQSVRGYWHSVMQKENRMSDLINLPQLVDEYSQMSHLSFDDKGASIIEKIQGVDNHEMVELLTTAGCIPEAYDHDSSEEKLYAKAMDILVAESLSRVGYSANVYQERSGTADVIATWTNPNSRKHSLVADAKAFRLSRTALNPKDYKIEALSTWKRDADFSLLVGPVAGFPEGTSRLYAEALRYRVVLLSYSHLAFMIEHAQLELFDPYPIWDSSDGIRNAYGTSPRAGEYWAAFDNIFQETLHVAPTDWHSTRQRYLMNLLELAEDQVAHFERVKQQVGRMSHSQLVNLAIEALKIDNKIEAIRRRSEHTQALLDEVTELEH